MSMSKQAISVCIYTLLSFHVSINAVANAPDHPNNRATISEFLKKADQKYNQISDYTCLFHKKELIGKKIIDQKNMYLKFRKPQYIYLKWTEGDKKGSEALFAKGKYNNKIVARVKNICVSVDPNGFLARRNTRHPITEIGLGYLLSMVKKNYFQSIDANEGTIQFIKETVTGGRKALLFEAHFPENRGYYAPRVLIYLDNEWCMPLKIEAYKKEGDFLAMYEYTDIKLNVGLSDKDFDKNNPSYTF